MGLPTCQGLFRDTCGHGTHIVGMLEMVSEPSGTRLRHVGASEVVGEAASGEDTATAANASAGRVVGEDASEEDTTATGLTF